MCTPVGELVCLTACVRSVFVLALLLWCATAMPLYDEIELLQEDGEQQPAGEQEEQSSESVG